LESLRGGLHAFEDVDATAAATGLAALVRLAEGLQEAGGEEGGFSGVLSRFDSP